ncbi:hypothetical protein C4D60_Mb08t11870 [Musa balbisiana]|uniref:Uncharacterized protein n=1 Tax=Musa balbisiana TaxID=52838 RepID=A0A4S8K336_MUSBA|nr:hypothetical protein C4D60_Mb08t11870 [Musa balbisiana]
MLAVVADRCLHLVNGVNHLPLDESSFIASNLWTISSSVPLLPITSVENFPEPHNRSQLRPLKNNLLSPQHRSFVSDSGIVGSLHSSSCRLSSEYHGSSLSLQMRHPPVATQSPKVGTFQPMTTNFSRETTKINLSPDTLHDTLDYPDNNFF